MADGTRGDKIGMNGGFPIRKMARRLLALALLLIAAGAPAQPSRPAAYYGLPEAPRGAALLRGVMLDGHNAERAALGLPPLAWDETLAGEAARYATAMAGSGIFRHSARSERATPSGENLWAGPRGLHDYGAMLGTFLDERPLLRPGARLPDLSRSGRWQDVGHYSQLIWRGTRRLGCALAEGPDKDYLVCRYFPAGNIFGRGPLDDDPATLASQSAAPYSSTKSR